MRMPPFITTIAAALAIAGCGKNGGTEGKDRKWTAPGQVVTYVWPRSVRPSPIYDVTAGGQTQRVLTTEEPHICAFGCTDTVEVTVSFLKAKVSEVAVRPLDKHFTHRLKANGDLVVRMAPGDKCVVEFNGSIENPLFLFADPVEEKPAREDCAYWFEAGNEYNKHLTLSKGTVYIEGGAWLNGDIHILNASGVRICGHGLVFGTGGNKPLFINGSDDVSVDGIILVNHDFWSTLAAQSTNVSFTNYKVVAPASSNDQGHENDALDILGCSHVRINGCFTYCHDDALCIKSQKWLYSGKVEDVRAENCTIWNFRNGTTLEIGVELNQDCSDVHFKDIWCVHSGGGMNRGLYRAGIGIKQTAGGRISDFSFENIHVEDAREFGIYLGIYKGSASIGNDVEWTPGTIDGISFKDIYIDGPAPYGNVASGYDADHAIRNVTFDGLYRNGVKVARAEDFFTEISNAEITIR